MQSEGALPSERDLFAPHDLGLGGLGWDRLADDGPPTLALPSQPGAWVRLVQGMHPHAAAGAAGTIGGHVPLVNVLV